MNMSDLDRKRYEKFLINTVRDQDVFDTAKEEALEVGREVGREIGREEEKIRRDIVFVKKCVKKGMAIADISELTELPISRINEIIKMNYYENSYD